MLKLDYILNLFSRNQTGSWWAFIKITDDQWEPIALSESDQYMCFNNKNAIDIG